jgi:hypothetical protein
MNKKVMMILGIVGALAIGLFAVAAVGAQEDVTPDATDGLTRPVDDLVSRVAEKLGVSEDEFVDAWNESATEIIDEKVASGELDEDVAEEIKERIAESEGIWLPRGPHGPHHGPGLMLVGYAAQEVLDTEQGELREAFADGKSLLDVAIEKGFTEQEFTDAMLASIKAELDEKVADGALDQDKADEIYERISENISDIINHKMGDGPVFDGPAFGPRPGFAPFGPFGPFDGDDDGDEDDDTSDTGTGL